MTRPASNSIAFWELNLEDEEQSTLMLDAVQPLIHTSGTVDIGIFEEQEDVRRLVDKEHTRPGGKYHSILKLFLLFEASETWTTATGWLSKDNIVVTAAHCIYNHGRRLKHAKACIGFNAGSQGTDISTAEYRFVKRVTTPLEWIKTATDQHDVAFLQLDRPFHNVMPVAYGMPEISTHQSLTVVGYPVDLRVNGLPGGEMYEIKIDRDIDLERTKNNLLRYQGDEKGGFSGAPVIRDRDFTVVGVHIRGGSFNSAAVIGGPYGVSFQLFEEVIGMLEEDGGTSLGFVVEVDDARDWLKYVHVPSNTQLMCSSQDY